MSILGKLGGAAAGFMLGGGPVGALIGAVAGHFLIDREMPQLSPGEAPGVVHAGEAAFLERVADIFGFTQNAYRRIRAAHIGPDKGDPYVIMGVAFDAGDDEVKATYRMLVRENHPDKLIARGVPEEFIRLATDKLAVINAAYDRIEKERGWRT